MPRPLVATIDLSAMRHNLSVAKSRVPAAKVWAVVKANAYGHGLERGMRAFADADGLALIEIEGAARLREMGWTKPILLLEGCFDAADLERAAAHDIQIAVHCREQIEMLEGARAGSQLPPVHVHLKMNSGMNRLGFMPEEFAAAHARLASNPQVHRISLMTHLANADADNPVLSVQQQVQRFVAGSAGIEGERSLSNSAADLLYPDLPTDWVRPGIMLYGGSPGGASAREFGLRAAMTLSSEIIGVQRIAAGDSVGYGSRFVADRPRIIGVVACGYADGYPRHAPNGTPVIVDGHRTGIVGRVSMDMLSVDLSEIPNAGVGSRVTLWGEDLPIDEVAQAAGTIGYELMCALALRVRIVER